MALLMVISRYLKAIKSMGWGKMHNLTFKMDREGRVAFERYFLIDFLGLCKGI
jgi:hypothetical protein